jgi:hypothetical protein
LRQGVGFGDFVADLTAVGPPDPTRNDAEVQLRDHHLQAQPVHRGQQVLDLSQRNAVDLPVPLDADGVEPNFACSDVEGAGRTGSSTPRESVGGPAIMQLAATRNRHDAIFIEES